MLNNFATNALMIGLISSITASFLTLLGTFIYNKYWYYRKYGKIAGIYRGYGYKEESSEWKLKDEEQSEATITHLGENKLNIMVSKIHNKRYLWQGTISMESENHGSLSWKYIKWKGQKYGDKLHKYGFKRVEIVVDDKSVYFYLNPELGDGFEKEVFIKNN